MIEQNPLVSIIVITYNSSKFVLETLESAKAQTYRNTELIVSDDCSTDNTVDICKEWLMVNKDRFVNSKLITIDHNTGISANINRGIKASKGEWIKIIAADDLLIEDCIESNLKFINNHKEQIRLIHSNSEYYKEEFKKENFVKKTDKKNDIFNLKSITPRGQFKALLFAGVFINAPTVFAHRSIYEKFNYYDERMKLIEDYPFWLKLTNNNVKIYFNDIVTIRYRQHLTNISNMPKIGPDYEEKKIERNIRYTDYILPNINFFERLLLRTSIYLNFLDKEEVNGMMKSISLYYHIALKLYMRLYLKYFFRLASKEK